MRKFYEQEDESFSRRKVKKKHRKLMLIIFTYLILLFVISLLPLIYFITVAKTFAIFKSSYFLNSNSPVGLGAYTFRNDKYSSFLSDIFFGSFKPLMFITNDGKFLRTVEFSDSLSNVNGKNLFTDTKVTLTVGNNSFNQTYYANDNLLLEKDVSINNENIDFDFRLNNSQPFDLVFYSQDKMAFNSSTVTIDKTICQLSLATSYSSRIQFNSTDHTLEIINSNISNPSISFSLLDENCFERGYTDIPPIESRITWIYLLYPLFTVILIAIFWRLYDR